MPTTTQFTIRLLLPIAAIAALTLLALAGFLWWSAEQVDNSEFQRERLLMQQALEQQQSQMLLAQQGVAIWDDSVAALERGDIVWLVENLGTYHYDAYGYERAIVVDHGLNPVISVFDGYAIPPDTARPALAALAPMFASLKDDVTRAHIAAFSRGARDTPPHAMAFARFEGQPALIGIMPILSFSGRNARPPAPRATWSPSSRSMPSSPPCWPPSITSIWFPSSTPPRQSFPAGPACPLPGSMA